MESIHIYAVLILFRFMAISKPDWCIPPPTGLECEVTALDCTRYNSSFIYRSHYNNLHFNYIYK